jgi:membrane protease YdiL (CAAX protease family)
MANDLTQPVYVESQNSVRAFIIRNSFLVYVVLTLILGWIPWYLGIQPTQIWFVPFLTALIMAPIVGGRKGLGTFLRRMVRIRAPWYTWVLVIFLPALIAIASLGIHVLLGGQLPEAALLNLNSTTLVQIALLGVLYLLPLGSENLAEFGFRGFGIPALQKKWGSLVGTLILGLFVSLWFLPQFFNESSPQAAMGGLNFLPFFILIEVGWSFMMTWVFNKSRGSSLIAGYIFHSAFNYWVVVLLVSASVVGGEIEFATTFDNTLLRINAVLILLTAIGFIVGTKGKLGYEPEGEMEAGSKAKEPAADLAENKDPRKINAA